MNENKWEVKGSQRVGHDWATEPHIREKEFQNEQGREMMWTPNIMRRENVNFLNAF